MTILTVIIHYPKGDDNVQELKKRVAKFHAQYVVNKIQSMQLSNDKMQQLIDILCDKAKQT